MIFSLTIWSTIVLISNAWQCNLNVGWQTAGKDTPEAQLERLDEEKAFVIFYKKALRNSLPLNLLKSAIPRRVNASYKIIQSTNMSGYGIPDGETYGELTMNSQQVLSLE
jgi:hypothetical protein